MAEKNPGVPYEVNAINHESPAIQEILRDRGHEPEDNLVANMELV